MYINVIYLNRESNSLLSMELTAVSCFDSQPTFVVVNSKLPDLYFFMISYDVNSLIYDTPNQFINS